MATDKSTSSSKGLDSSKETNPQSPQHRAGHAQDHSQYTKGSVKTK